MPQKYIPIGEVILRVPTYADAEAMYKNWTSDNEVTKYLIWKPHSSVEETRIYIEYILDSWKTNSEYTWVVCTRNNNEPIGSISVGVSGFKGSMGYVLSKRYWRNGYTYLSAQKVIDIAFSELRLKRVGSYCDIDNTPSRKLLEKLGMELEGLKKSWLIHPCISSEPRDCYSFAILSDVKSRETS